MRLRNNVLACKYLSSDLELSMAGSTYPSYSPKRVISEELVLS